jgi:hypothetical protein
MRWGMLRAYSNLQSRDVPDQEGEEREKMFYGDYSYELARERMDTAIRAREHDQLVKELRSVRKGPHSGGLVARTSALLMTLFR